MWVDWVSGSYLSMTPSQVHKYILIYRHRKLFLFLNLVRCDVHPQMLLEAATPAKDVNFGRTKTSEVRNMTLGMGANRFYGVFFCPVGLMWRVKQILPSFSSGC